MTFMKFCVLSALAADASNSTCAPAARHAQACWHDVSPHLISQFASTSPDDCCAACDKLAACKAWTLNLDMATCFLKDGLDIDSHKGNCTSGGVILPPPPSPPTPPPGPHPPNASNVLMILIDDIRPELGVYGSHVSTPNMDKIARSALTLTNAYIQYSFCCPSRNSFLSGRRPSKTKVWTFKDHFREPGVGEDWTSLPEWFKDHGYFTHGLGKLFHPNLPPNADPKSWSDPAHVSDGAGQLPALPPTDQPIARAPATSNDAFEAALASAACITGEQGGSYCELPGTQGPDDALAANGAESLRMLANYSKASGSPFFLGIGLHKPHIPWTIPTRFFQLVGPAEQVALPKHEAPPAGMPPVAWNKGLGTHALDSYKDANEHPLHSFANGSSVPFPHELTRAMRRGYYAAVACHEQSRTTLLLARAQPASREIDTSHLAAGMRTTSSARSSTRSTALASKKERSFP